jgi:hypothetical protein
MMHGTHNIKACLLLFLNELVSNNSVNQ